MSVWRDLGAVRPDGPTVVTIGNFDGVHRGHRAVLGHAAGVAGLAAAPVVAVTFDPHPMSVLAPERAPVLLTDIDQRAELLLAAGAGHVLVLGFDRAVAGWSPDEFIRRVLHDALHTAQVVVGADFRFGARAAGDVDTLRAAGIERGFTVDAVPLAIGGQERPWSSSSVRSALAVGDVAAAAEVLGRDHAVRGVVVEGDHRGRELGYPTANVPADPRLAVPADGVYAGTLRRLDRDPAGTGGRAAGALPAAISVGTNPTFDGVLRRVEAYVVDRDDLDLYGVPVEIAFHERLRGQERFDDVTELLAQMARDVQETRRAVGRG